MSGLRGPRHVLQAAKEVGVLHDQASGLSSESRSQRRRIQAAVGPPLHLVDGEVESLEIGPQNLSIGGVDRLGNHDPAAAGDPSGHEGSLCHSGTALVHRSVGYVHAGEPRDHGLVLVDGSQRALARLRLVGRVGGVEFSSPEEVVHHRRDKVPVGAGP